MEQLGNRYHCFEKVYFFVILIYAGMAVPFTRNINAFYDNIGFIIPVLLTLILIVRNRISFVDKKFIILLFLLTVWHFLMYIKYGNLKIGDIFFLYYNIIIGYILLKVYGRDIWSIYLRYISILSGIALIGYVLAILSYSLVEQIMIFKFSSSDSILRGNNLLFSLTNINCPYFDTIGPFFRNSGFTWEPGRFACFVVVAIFILSIKRGAKTIYSTREGKILLLALITSMSTTGYSSFILIVGLYVFLNMKERSMLFFILPIFITCVIFVFQLDFMGSKILNLSDVNENREYLENSFRYLETTDVDKTYVPQRFDGLMFDWLNFINDPILGYGKNDANSFCAQNIYSNIGLSNGLISVLSRYGIILGALFYWCLYKSSQKLSEDYRYKGKLIFMWLFCLLSISYSFMLIPIFSSFWMYGIFVEAKKQK